MIFAIALVVGAIPWGDGCRVGDDRVSDAVPAAATAAGSPAVASLRKPRYRRAGEEE